MPSERHADGDDHYWLSRCLADLVVSWKTYRGMLYGTMLMVLLTGFYLGTGYWGFWAWIGLTVFAAVAEILTKRVDGHGI